ncbi:MAG: hypothetical protein KatS3mg129_2960 [Leptospiraceae bacterium]|nr:MAG: hypothetical protein KatS3mg129_2960 [Leptospiraceae bacterium]
MKAKSNKKIIYYSYGVDLFGYYYLESTLKNKNKISKKYKIYNDSIHFILSLDKELYKYDQKNYNIIILNKN